MLDKETLLPIHGATIIRKDLKRPYIIVGGFVPVEKVTTDENGFAHLKDNDGIVTVEAKGYQSSNQGLPSGTPSQTIELMRLVGSRQ